jgi:hypothetical protein
VPIDPDLLAICACPSDDHAPLREVGGAGGAGGAAGDRLVCTFCQTSYPIRDGIPVLLIDDATPGPTGIGVAAPAQ